MPKDVNAHVIFVNAQLWNLTADKKPFSFQETATTEFSRWGVIRY
jgi:hypothetical protein